MADNVGDENALATFMTNIYTELFVSSPSNPNAPINTTQHLRKEFLWDDKNIEVVATSLSELPFGNSLERLVSNSS